MADAEKPYRLYKGGRTRGKVPTAPRPERPAARGVEPHEAARQAAVGPANRPCGARAGRPAARLARRELPRLPQRRQGGERAAAEGGGGEPRAPGRPPADEAVADHVARHRRRQDRSAPGLPPLRLDPARPHRPEAAPDGVSDDPARPPRRHSRPGAEQDQRRLPARWAGADDEDRPGAHRPAAEPCRPRRLRQLQGGDRRARRGRDRRAEADPLQPLRLPLRDRSALPGVAGLAFRARARRR